VLGAGDDRFGYGEVPAGKGATVLRCEQEAGAREEGGVYDRPFFWQGEREARDKSRIRLDQVGCKAGSVLHGGAHLVGGHVSGDNVALLLCGQRKYPRYGQRTGKS
jgi:hypothetical protein